MLLIHEIDQLLLGITTAASFLTDTAFLFAGMTAAAAAAAAGFVGTALVSLEFASPLSLSTKIVGMSCLDGPFIGSIL